MTITLFEKLSAQFPNPENAPGDEPLAYGGNLKLPMLLAAYSRGFFPWFNEGQPILWWNPDPRYVLFPANFRISSRSKRALASKNFSYTFNQAFSQVIRACAAPRKYESHTWISAQIIEAYELLHKAGYAHSVESWLNGHLVGGAYGVVLGKAFFGESMFHTEPEASRGALRALVALLEQEHFLFLDCQQQSPHMVRMGAEALSRKKFMNLLNDALKKGQKQNCEVCPYLPWTTKYIYDYQGNIWHEIV